MEETKGLETKKANLVLIDFNATWCGPCQTMEPIVDKVKDSFRGELEVLRVDVDENSSIAKNFKIKSVPTLILLKSGKPIWRHSGILSKKDLETAIKLKL